MVANPAIGRSKYISVPGLEDTKFGVSFNLWFELNSHQLDHTRQVYGILDALGDFGGVEGFIFIVGTLLLSSVSTHAFYIKAI